jgi:protein O-GlcNAc transferase
VAAHPARLVVRFLGTHHSLFAPWIDYRITCARSEPPDWGRPLLEKRAYLPRTLFPYDVTSFEPGPAPPRAVLGLPDDAFVMCVFNQVVKICPTVFSIWMAALQHNRRAVLWLMDCAPATRARLREHASTHGIDPRRLIFAPRVAHAAHVARQRAADIFLDTFTFNAHTMGLDALHAHLPIITCPGSSWSSRIGASFLSAVGLDELIAESPAHYLKLALQLSDDAPRLAQIRARLAKTMNEDNPFDSRRVAADLERAFEAMWRRYLRDLPGTDLSV